MHRFMRATLLALAFYWSPAAQSQTIPPALRDWQGWVLKGEEFRRCPFLSSDNISADEPVDASLFRCTWPERLVLSVDARGGTFSQRWQVYADSWVELPGDAEHWPSDVRLNGAPAALVDRDGPKLRLSPGNYTIAGRFEWSSRPEALPLPDETAVIDLTVDGQRVAQPERPDGAVWLGRRRSAEQAAALEVQVYRLIRDDIPVYLLTSIRLNVAGDAREEVLARVLPEGFVPLALSGPLPARLERDGALRVQVRPGSHIITLAARATGVATRFGRPDPGSAKWAREEIWSFAANDELRVAAAEGADGIDPAQANVPPDWRQYPAFRMDRDSWLTIAERSRGIADADDNRLSLTRNLWLDFDHGGFTAVDSIIGTMRRDWRLDMRAPFALASGRQNNEQLLVTRGSRGQAGLELRQPKLALTTVARKPAGDAMPATGWDQRFDRVVGTLHLPPGHRLLAVIGADAAPQSWWEQWGLWNVFGVALVVVFVYWSAGRQAAALAALALLLTYQEAPAYIWVWGNLLAALAIARAAPDGRFQKLARFYRTASFVALGLALLPFLFAQFRYAIYPQLAPSPYQTNYSPPPLQAGKGENPYGLEALWEERSVTDYILPSKRAAPEPAPPPEIESYAPAAKAAAAPAPVELDGPAPAEIARSRNVEEDKSLLSSVSGNVSKNTLNAAQVVPRYAAGTVLQAGPGVPHWGYNSYAYFWSGPVETTDTVRFIYVGPVLMFFWRILGIGALIALFLSLANLSYGGQWRLPGLPRAGASAASMTPLALLLLALCGSPPARAEAPAPPAPNLLEELKTRLTAAPDCAPSCASIVAARVNVDGERLDVVLQVNALASVAVPMPYASDRWQLDDVSVDARSSLAIGREQDASLWVPLTPGAHTVHLAGRLASAESLQLAFPQAPRVIDVRASGWTVSGVNEGRLVSGSLELARERGAQRAGANLEAGSEFPAFVRVERTFNLDLDWTIDTEVNRVAPQRAAVSLEIPLVPGESVLTPGVEVREGKNVLVGLAAGETQKGWHSGLNRADSLELSLPADAARGEIWNFAINPQWNVVFEGFPPILPADVDAPMWLFRFAPRPGEKLTLKVTRPEPVAGTTLAIDRVSQLVSAGSRSTETLFLVSMRTTQGGRHVIKVPVDARVTSVKFDRQPQQLRPQNGELPLSLTPGDHSVEVRWERAENVSWRTRPPAVDLGSPASNLEFAILLPESRWPLFAYGPGIGPVVRYWGELAVFIAIAWMLGRWSRSPLRFLEWLLLGLGLSTQSWWVFSVTGAWLFLMRWRNGWTPASNVRVRFNIVQVLLALFTLFVIALLVFSGIRNGLLASPDMGVADMATGEREFRWFVDQTAGVIEPPTVISAPMWLYRALFFAWACWMAFALVRWLRWAFNAWKSGGLWRVK